MEVQFTPDQEAFVRQAIASGRYQTAEDAVRDALARWEADERARIDLIAALDEAEADLENGQYGDYTDETLPTLADELKREARGSTTATDGVSAYQAGTAGRARYLAPYCRRQ